MNKNKLLPFLTYVSTLIILLTDTVFASSSPFTNDRSVNSDTKVGVIIMSALERGSSKASKGCAAALSKKLETDYSYVYVDGKVSSVLLELSAKKATICAAGIGSLSSDIERALIGSNSVNEAISALANVFDEKLGSSNRSFSEVMEANYSLIVNQPGSVQIPYFERTGHMSISHMAGGNASGSGGGSDPASMKGSMSIGTADAKVTGIDGYEFSKSNGLSISYTTKGMIYEANVVGIKSDLRSKYDYSTGWKAYKQGITILDLDQGIVGGRQLSFSNKSNRSFEVSK
jgi:hypothetical protein